MLGKTQHTGDLMNHQFVKIMEKNERMNGRPFRHKDLATLYKVSSKTLRHWLRPFGKEIGQRIGHYYNNRQVGIIFERLGLPGNKEE